MTLVTVESVRANPQREGQPIFRRARLCWEVKSHDPDEAAPVHAKLAGLFPDISGIRMTFDVNVEEGTAYLVFSSVPYESIRRGAVEP